MQKDKDHMSCHICESYFINVTQDGIISEREPQLRNGLHTRLSIKP